jgi:quinol monooxygenase YgiN
MLIVAGAFTLDPTERDAFIAGRRDSMRATRDEPGCLEYVMAADPLDETRVVLFERWADQASFDGHMAVIAAAERPAGPAPKGMSVEIYDISGVRSFG